jgi:hypothetical protein
MSLPASGRPDHRTVSDLRQGVLRWPPPNRRKQPGQNLEKARKVQSARAHGAKIPKQAEGLSTAGKDKMPDKGFAFPKQRKEPLTDARHVRNAIARFGQVEDVTDAERDKAWKRILTAAKRFNVDISETSWRELGKSSTSTRKR